MRVRSPGPARGPGPWGPVSAYGVPRRRVAYLSEHEGANRHILDRMSDELHLDAVVALAQAMAVAPTLPAAAARAAAGARRALGGDFAAVSRWDRAGGRLRVLVNDGDLAPGEVPFPVDESYPVHDFPEITESSQPGSGCDSSTSVVSAPPAWVEHAGGAASDRSAALHRRGRTSCVVAPLVLDGRAWGELYVARGAGGAEFAHADAEFATVLAGVAAAGIAQHERLAEVRRLAFTDPLTGLGNRRAVDERLAEVLGGPRDESVVVSLVVCDVNGLKGVNDRYGHAAGDRLLERFGSLLSRCGAALPGSLAARLGGDEFCLLAVGPPADEVVRAAAELCARAVELTIGEGVACGVASTGDPIGRVRSGRRLLRLADAAQYRAKAARAAGPVVAGREIAALADAPRPPSGDRRRFRRR